MIDNVYAMAQQPAEGQEAATMGAGILPFVLIFLVFYFLLIRPQKKQMRRQQEMIKSLKRGMNIVTSGGLHGKITALKGKELEIEIAPKTRVTINRQAVSGVRDNPESSKEQK